MLRHALYLVLLFFSLVEHYYYLACGREGAGLYLFVYFVCVNLRP